MRIKRVFFPKTGEEESSKEESQYLGVDLLNTIRELTLTLDRGLRFDDNFETFDATFEAGSLEEVKIQNQLRVIPNEWFVVDIRNGGQLIRGTTDWTQSDLYLLNIGSAGQFKVRFFYTGVR